MPHLRLLLVLLLLASCDTGSMDAPPIDNPGQPDLTGSDIPLVVIDTQGQTILNEPKVPATMTIYRGDAVIATSSIGIEYRGSSSFRLSDKKSFGIETWDAGGNDVDQSFFGFPEEEDWILMGHIVNQTNGYILDRTLMYHYLGYQLSNRIGRYASRTQFVELSINGDYLGVYVFMEKLKRGGDRIDVERLAPDVMEGDNLTGGYVLKIDKTTGGNQNIGQPLDYFNDNWADDAVYTPDISFRSIYSVFGDSLDFEPYGPPYHPQMPLETYFLYEYPNAEGINAAQKRYLQDYITAFETALLTDDFSSTTRAYTDYIDLDSFVDYFLLNELVRNVDGYRLSTYLQKARGSKLAMGPIWDLNIGYDTGDRIPFDDWVINYNSYVSGDAWMMPFWWPRLMEDPLFRDALKTRWSQLRLDVLSTPSILSLVDETAAYLTTNGAVERNYERWRGIPVDYTASIQSLKDFLSFRASWMDSAIQSL